MITTLVDTLQIGLHGFISSLPTVFIVCTVEERATPQKHQTTLQCQRSTSSYTAFLRPSRAILCLGSQHISSLVQVIKNKLVSLLRRSTRSNRTFYRILCFLNQRHTAIPLEQVVIAPCTEEIYLTEQFILLFLRKSAAADTLDYIIDITDSTIYRCLDIGLVAHEEIRNRICGTGRAQLNLWVYKRTETTVFLSRLTSLIRITHRRILPGQIVGCRQTPTANIVYTTITSFIIVVDVFIYIVIVLLFLQEAVTTRAESQG